MKDLIGPRGLKGDTGERGLPGRDSKCKCNLITFLSKIHQLVLLQILRVIL